MSQFLHNPSLILTDSIKQLNLQLSIWLYLSHSSFLLHPLHTPPPRPPLHLWTLSQIFFFSPGSSFSLSLSLFSDSDSFLPQMLSSHLLSDSDKTSTARPQGHLFLNEVLKILLANWVQNSWWTPLFFTFRLISLPLWAVWSSKLVQKLFFSFFWKSFLKIFLRKIQLQRLWSLDFQWLKWVMNKYVLINVLACTEYQKVAVKKKRSFTVNSEKSLQTWSIRGICAHWRRDYCFLFPHISLHSVFSEHS